MRKILFLAILGITLFVPIALSFQISLNNTFALGSAPNNESTTTPEGGGGGDEGLVPCGNGATQCTIADFSTMVGRIYNFIVIDIAGPLAIVAITVGAIIMLISAGNPGLLGKGKTILYSGIIGLVLTVGSYAIINFVYKIITGG